MWAVLTQYIWSEQGMLMLSKLLALVLLTSLCIWRQAGACTAEVK